jgi:hypothetical protein
MDTVLVQTGSKEPITSLVVNKDGAPLTGLSDLAIQIHRTSDNSYFDWDDNTFKTYGAVTQLKELLSEVHATASPGVYQLNTADHTRGFDTSKIANPDAAGDHYVFVLTQEIGDTAANLPQTGELAVGDWVDHIDQAISENATPAEVQAELRAIRLHQLVSVNPGAIQPGTGTYIKQILDSLGGESQYLVLQNYSYDKNADTLSGSVWVEHQNLVLSSPVSVSVAWVDAATDTVLFTMTDSAPDARGFFYIEQSIPGLTAGKAYYALATVTLAGGSTVAGGKGSFVF